ncbi:MAG: iron chelate uptake ABC transporter family permease subunit [Erysipelothrix sp.]|nr:iron chelate uptake ABC transporter family permease subunit [Erysipelothrix sp.]
MKINLKYIVLIIVLAFISLSIGNMEFSWIDLINLDSSAINVFITSRFPRLVAVLLTGIGLSISGLILQQLVRNKFVSPSTTATANSARLGIMVSLVLLPQLTTVTRSLFAFAFALAGTGLFVWMIQRIKLKDVIFTPLIGMMLGTVIDSITTFLALHFDVLQVLNGYMIGSFTLTIKGRYELLYLLIPVILITYAYARYFNIAALGEDYASNLGLNYKKILVVGIMIVSLNSAVIISTIGNIAFVGLIIPNLVSIRYGDKIDSTITITALMGSIFLLAADIISRLIIYPYEIPISLTVGVIGSIIFLILILRRNKNEK